MSLQHQNKSLPKHLQHARLQKEEDEEQWISGEELCTEGSSDEESKVKDFKKKLKGSAQSSASSLKSRIYSSSNTSIKEKSDNSEDPSSSKLVEWRPKRDDESDFYDIKAERLDTEMKWKTTLKELEFNKNLYKNSSSNLSESQINTNKLLYDFQKDDCNFDELIQCSEYITDNIVTLDKEIETFDSILEGCKKNRMVFEQDICCQINSLNICKITSESTVNFHKICNYKKERSAKKKRKKSGKNPRRLYSRANKFKMMRQSKMVENPSSKLTKEQSSRLEDLLKETDDNETKNNNCFKHTNNQLEDIDAINNKLKTLQEKSDDADLNSKKTSEEFLTADVVDEENREWKNYFKVKNGKLCKINNRLKVFQNLKSTESNKVPNHNTAQIQQ